ncbi:DeoR/GlpR transcriptional regulator [Microvirga sp. KLBC 81]|uniref:DeoR/GlpR family DNA-binding transcription regulator n=1 Tax=Microvirga sp. KLBC 81 TaxID=1862707 RepID=UPI000D50FBC3|nr:DeoR/GlpR family DNA-binding transcription regulator [Microvirga sp. KLBC 81]PVE22402.1 DeoR/GlpR transcriptional regulator [Microvirga sp. KLBC 81]
MKQVKTRFPHERQQQIYDLLAERKMLGTAELAKLLNISLPTVRRDLATMVQAGLLARTHGGAVAVGSSGSMSEPLFLEKLRLRQNLKQRVGAAAAELVELNKVIVIDSGTTGLALARALAGRPVTIVALDLKVAEAAATGQTEVLIPGGRVRNGYYSLVGSWSSSLLKDIRADIFFMAADAIDETGVTNSTLDEADVKRAAMAQAKRTVLIADHSKIGTRSFVHVCPLDRIDMLVTDRGAKAALQPYHSLFREIRLV